MIENVNCEVARIRFCRCSREIVDSKWLPSSGKYFVSKPNQDIFFLKILFETVSMEDFAQTLYRAVLPFNLKLITLA